MSCNCNSNLFTTTHMQADSYMHNYIHINKWMIIATVWYIYSRRCHLSLGTSIYGNVHAHINYTIKN